MTKRCLVVLLCWMLPAYLLASNEVDSLSALAEKYRQLNDIPHQAEAEFRLGKHHYSNEEDTLAILHIQRSISLYAQIDNGRGLATCYNLLGNLLSDHGRNEESVSMYRAALKALSRANNDTLRSQITNNLGLVQKDIGNYEESLRLLFEALRLKERIHATPKSISSTLLNIGLVFDVLARYDYAIKYYQLSLDIKVSEKDSLGISRILSNMATTFKNKGDLQKGIEMIERSNLYNQKIGNKEQIYINATNLGNIKKLQGHTGEALRHFEVALAYADDLGNITYQSDIHQNLGSLYFETGQYPRSVEHYKKALLYASAAGSLAQLQEVNERLSHSYAQLNQPDAAYRHLLASNQYRDRIYSLEGSKAMEEMKVRYETEKKEKQIAQQEADIAQQEIRAARQQNLLVYSLLGILGVLLMAAFLIQRLRMKGQRIRQQAQLDLQNERLRISRDLHDHIGAELTLIASALGTQSFRASGAEKAELNTLFGYAESAMQQLRETAWAIRKESIPLSDFHARVCKYALKMTSAKGIQFIAANEASHEIQLSPVQTINLFRVCQEAISNAVKHSGGSVIRFTIRLSLHQLCCVIEDNGRGMEEGSVTAGEGLQNMRERIRELKGELTILPAKGGGTAVTSRIPVSHR